MWKGALLRAELPSICNPKWERQVRVDNLSLLLMRVRHMVQTGRSAGLERSSWWVHRLQNQSSSAGSSRAWTMRSSMRWSGVIQGVAARGVFSRGGLWGAVSAESKEPGVCGCVGVCGALLCVCWLTSAGTLNFLHLDSFQLGWRGLAQRGSSRSSQRSMQREGEVLVEQRAWAVSVPSLGLAHVYPFIWCWLTWEVV